MDFLPERGMMPGTGDTITRGPPRNHSPAFKAKVALAAVKGEKTQSQGDYYSRGRKPLQRIGAEQEAD